MAETARSRVVSGSSANGRTAAQTAVANHHPGSFLITQDGERALNVVGPWYGQGTPRYLLRRHRYAAFLKTATYRAGWHRSTNMVFDCESNLRRASVRARGIEDPAAFEDCAQCGMLVCSSTLSRRGELLKLEMGERKARTTFTPGCTYARACVPCCPSRLQHVARGLSDARCSWVRRKNGSAQVHPVLSPCTPELDRLYYTPPRPLRSSVKAETVTTECYIVPQAHRSGQKKAVGQLTCISF
jgi:hypothetical protein